MTVDVTSFSISIEISDFFSVSLLNVPLLRDGHGTCCIETIFIIESLFLLPNNGNNDALFSDE